MIIFNTIKKAEHYVKYCNKKIDFDHGGYDWSTCDTFIEGQYVKQRHAGDGCGCGCDNYLYDYVDIIGRIKSHDTKTIRGNKIDQILD